jgi:hypothetical protein
LHDIHLSHGCGGVFLGTDDASLMSVVLELTHDIHNYCLKRVQMTSKGETIFGLVKGSLYSSLINLRRLCSCKSITRSMTLSARLISFSVVNSLLPSSRTANDPSIHARVSSCKLMTRNDGSSLMSTREYVRRNARWSYRMHLRDLTNANSDI